MPRPLKLYRGQFVRLKLDFRTRGGRTFRKGVRMKVQYTDGKYTLGVWVRGRHHQIIVDKKWAGSYLEPEPLRIGEAAGEHHHQPGSD